jgi:sulfatase maturation enzyme AslB (radical SAM superfamily)
VRRFLEEIAAHGLPTREIGFTGGEPFMNPEIIEMTEDALARGHEVLILTNAMQPMLRPRVGSGLLKLRDEYGGRLTLRVSLDHYTKALHETERGEGTFEETIEGLDWLARAGFKLAIAGRTCWSESEDDARASYARLTAAGRSMFTTVRGSCCFRKWTRAQTCPRSLKPAGAFSARVRAKSCAPRAAWW